MLNKQRQMQNLNIQNNDNGCQQFEPDSAKPLKLRLNRRQNKQSDFIFKRYKYQENKIFKEKQNIQSEEYGFQRRLEKGQMGINFGDDQENFEERNLESMNNDLFMPADMIHFQDFGEDDFQNQFHKEITGLEHVLEANSKDKKDQQQPSQFSDNYDFKLAPRNGELQEKKKEHDHGQSDIKMTKKNSRIEGISQAINQGGSIIDSTSLAGSSCQDSLVRLNVGRQKESQNREAKLKQVEKKKDNLEDGNQYAFKKKQGKTEDLQTKQQEEQYEYEQIKGLRIQTDPDSSTVNIQITDKLKLISSPLPPGITLKCTIRRSKSLLNMINPQFDMYITNGFKHMISAKRYSMKNRELFKFSLDIGKYEAQECIARMNANLLHNEYWIVGRDQDIGYGQRYTNLFGAIIYEKIKKGQKVRDFKVIIPPVTKKVSIIIDSKATQIDMEWLQKQIQLVLCNFQACQPNGFKNPSQKNFKLYDGQDLQYLFLTFNKQSDNLYQMQINHPLSPLQAMAVVLTRFDAQLK